MRGGEFSFDLVAPPGRDFGYFQLLIQHAGGPAETVDFFTPGPHVHVYEEPTMVSMMFMSGRDVIVDNLSYGWMCDCQVPNEDASWGMIKQSYR